MGHLVFALERPRCRHVCRYRGPYGGIGRLAERYDLGGRRPIGVGRPSLAGFGGRHWHGIDRGLRAGDVRPRRWSAIRVGPGHCYGVFRRIYRIFLFVSFFDTVSY